MGDEISNAEWMRMLESAEEELRQAENKLKYHKYKRCIDKAERCDSEEKRLEAIAPLFDNDKECWEYGSDYWVKWRKRWLELAEKFKPNERTN